jgi:hypothetical protein
VSESLGVVVDSRKSSGSEDDEQNSIIKGFVLLCCTPVSCAQFIVLEFDRVVRTATGAESDNSLGPISGRGLSVLVHSQESVETLT